MFAPLSATMSAAGITCQVPFSFSFNGKTLPAGLYIISTRDRILTVNGSHGSASAMTTQTPSLANQMKLVFVKTGERYELVEAWTGGKNGFEVRRSAEPREEMSNVRVVIPIKK